MSFTMRTQRLWLGLPLLGGLLAACTVPHKEPPPSTEIDDVAYREHVRVLASDEFLGRKPGTAGEDKTVAYLVERLRKMGLKPGNGASYVQQVPLMEITGAQVSLSIGTADAKRSLVPGKDMVIWSKRALPLVQLSMSELVFVGYGIIAPEYAWNDYAGVDVHGKIVVVLANDPGYASKDPALFKGNSMSDYGRFAYKIQEATKQGAQGVLLVHDSAAVGYGWNVIQSTWSGAQFELLSADGNATHAAIEGWLQKDAANALFAAARLDFSRLAEAAAHPGFKAVPMGLTADATIHNALRQFNSANVIALLPGKSGHENIIYTAHWDGLGVDAARADHNIFNGAVDNASGVAGLLVLAQSFVRTLPAPERSIVFLATTAAEPGLLGAEYYVENPVFPFRQTVAVINVETLLEGGPTRDVSIVGAGNTDLEEMARAEALLQGRETHPEPNPQRGNYFRSDGYRFARRGVPVLDIEAGIDSAARGPAWGKAHLDDYYALQYRQPTDEYSPDWNVRGAVVDLTLYYQIGMRVARSHHLPRWYPNSEFRGLHQHGSEP